MVRKGSLIMKSIDYDQKNEQIIQLLADNPMLNNTQLAQIMKLSQPAIFVKVLFVFQLESQH